MPLFPLDISKIDDHDIFETADHDIRPKPKFPSTMDDIRNTSKLWSVTISDVFVSSENLSYPLEQKRMTTRVLAEANTASITVMPYVYMPPALDRIYHKASRQLAPEIGPMLPAH